MICALLLLKRYYCAKERCWYFWWMFFTCARYCTIYYDAADIFTPYYYYDISICCWYRFDMILYIFTRRAIFFFHFCFTLSLLLWYYAFSLTIYYAFELPPAFLSFRQPPYFHALPLFDIIIIMPSSSCFLRALFAFAFLFLRHFWYAFMKILYKMIDKDISRKIFSLSFSSPQPFSFMFFIIIIIMLYILRAAITEMRYFSKFEIGIYIRGWPIWVVFEKEDTLWKIYEKERGARCCAKRRRYDICWYTLYYCFLPYQMPFFSRFMRRRFFFRHDIFQMRADMRRYIFCPAPRLRASCRHAICHVIYICRPARAICFAYRGDMAIWYYFLLRYIIMILLYYAMRHAIYAP